MSVKENSVVNVSAYGKRRKVYVGSKRNDGSYSARVREPYTGNSVRGVLRVTQVGLRFRTSRPGAVWWS